MSGVLGMRQARRGCDLAERVDFHAIPGEHGCLIWDGCTDPDGYGRIVVCGQPKRAHRVAYELMYGPIPAGLTLDHLCRVTRCVNPLHLEAVTNRVNVLRGRLCWNRWREDVA